MKSSGSFAVFCLYRSSMIDQESNAFGRSREAGKMKRSNVSVSFGVNRHSILHQNLQTSQTSLRHCLMNGSLSCHIYTVHLSSFLNQSLHTFFMSLEKIRTLGDLIDYE